MFWIIMSIVLFILLCVAFVIIYRLLGVQEDIEDRINDSMDVLNVAHESIDEILHRPLFYNSPEIKNVIDQIKYAKDAIHAVAVEIAGANEENIVEESTFSDEA